jgi:DNA polymerase III subunit alpha
VGRTLGFTPAETDALAKLIPNAAELLADGQGGDGAGPRGEEALRAGRARYAQLLDYAISLEGLSRHTGVHAAGVVIAPGPLDDYVPICTQASKGSGAGERRARRRDAVRHERALEKAGMLKMDFLGLTTLTVITDAVQAS